MCAVKSVVCDFEKIMEITHFSSKLHFEETFCGSNCFLERFLTSKKKGWSHLCVKSCVLLYRHYRKKNELLSYSKIIKNYLRWIKISYYIPNLVNIRHCCQNVTVAIFQQSWDLFSQKNKTVHSAALATLQLHFKSLAWLLQTR